MSIGQTAGPAWRAGADQRRPERANGECAMPSLAWPLRCSDGRLAGTSDAPGGQTSGNIQYIGLLGISTNSARGPGTTGTNRQ
jgi:hypothetical protein